MKLQLTCAAIGLAALLAAPAHAGFKKIKTESQFQELVVGKTIVSAKGTVTKITANGKFSGKTHKGAKFHGAWKWHKTFWCRALVMDKKDRGTDCQVFRVNGNKVEVIRDKGRGETISGTLK